MCALCSFLAMPASLPFLFVNSVTHSPCWFDISPFLILATLCCFYSLSCIFLFSTYSLYLSWAIFSFFPMLCVPQCLFVLCGFQFQHSSLFSWFFSHFAFLFSFEYFFSLCLPLFDFMQFSLHIFLCIFVCVCSFVCL